MGPFHIYRVDTADVQVEFVSKTCECPAVNPETGKAVKPKEEDTGKGKDAKDIPAIEGK